MTTMIEQVKAAMLEAMRNNALGDPRVKEINVLTDIDGAFDMNKVARAAIEAMLVPNMRMVTAASEIVVGYDDFACGDGTIYLPADVAPVVWSSMIDAALNEKATT